MLKPFEDELIHSFIYRTHFVNGVGQFKGIVNLSGRWRGLPVIYKKTRPYYRDLVEEWVLRSLRRLGVAEEQRNLFRGSPFGYRRDLQVCLNVDGVRTRNYPTRSIRFCHRCIDVHLCRYGVGYMEASWFSGEYCLKHEEPLSQLVETSHSNSLASLRKIFQGIRTEESVRVRQSTYLVPVDFCFSNPIKFADCAVKEFEEFVLKYGHTFPKMVGWAIRTNLTTPMSLVNLSKPYFKKRIFDTLMRIEFRPFQDFLGVCLENIEVNAGVLDSESITENVLKSRKADCSNCTYRCLANTGPGLPRV